jgi:anti-sigma factor RsiW
VRCAESLRVQAYFDGELDASSAAEIERHAEHCVECRALLQDLEQVRNALRQDLVYERAAPALRSRVLQALDAEGGNVLAWPAQSRKTAARSRPFWFGALSGAGGTAIAATLALFLLLPSLTNPLVDDLVSAHVRSLMPDHLIDVVSTDRHTVKPWFAGHTDVSPVVVDFAAQGYTLIGGRADYFDRQRAAVVVYRHGAHTINVFSWAADRPALPQDTTRNGYHLAFFRVGNLAYCAVADTGWDELNGLVRLIRENGTREGGGGV